MAPNGLIFLVVVAIWAAYFVQYWIRRREHLSTARSMDRFSESMRVLARRSPLPQSSLETPAPRSYAVSPARSMRPQVLVKRADLATSTSVLSNQAGESPHAVMSGGAAHGPARVGPPQRDRRESMARPTSGVPRRLRALVLTVQLVLFLAVTALTVVGLVVWWAPLLAVLAIGCAAVWVGERVRAERASIRAGRGRPAARRRSGLRASSRRDVAAAAATPSQAAGDQGVEVAADREEAAPYGFEQPAAVVAADGASGVMPPAGAVDEDDIPLTWDPRPVPRPTYTMKARADRALPPPADVTPTPIGIDEDDDVRAVEPQRHTG